MGKGKLAVHCLVAISLLLCAGITPSAAHGLDPCRSSWELHTAVVPAPLFVCPQGDTDSFIEQGWWISITCIGTDGEPMPGIPPADIWLIDLDPVNDLIVCGGSASSNTDSMTNAAGTTTMSNSTLIGGGCADRLALVVQDLILMELDCFTHTTAAIQVSSPEQDGDLYLTLVDLTIFASFYPPQAYAACGDLNADGGITLVDLTLFALHFGPPGHQCNPF